MNTDAHRYVYLQKANLGFSVGQNGSIVGSCQHDHTCGKQCTEVHLASLLSGGFPTMVAMNQFYLAQIYIFCLCFTVLHKFGHTSTLTSRYRVCNLISVRLWNFKDGAQESTCSKNVLKQSWDELWFVIKSQYCIFKVKNRRNFFKKNHLNISIQATIFCKIFCFF